MYLIDLFSSHSLIVFIYFDSFQVIHGVHIEPAHIIKKRSISQPLRILLSYDDSVYRLDQDKFELINVSILSSSVCYVTNIYFLSAEHNLAGSCAFLGTSTDGARNERRDKTE